jgi:hypothetical protein
MLKVTIPAEYGTEEWRRLPKPGGRFFGISRSEWLDIIANPESGVRSICIKRPGRQRGVRLLYMPSVHEYFDRLAQEQEVAKCRL